MKNLILVTLLLFNIGSIQGQVAEISAGMATGIAIDKIKNGLTDVVNQSLDRADYSVAQAAIRALGIIDAWKDANEDLLNTAFDKLDKTTRDMLSKTASIVNQFDGSLRKNLETARQITENANQISESIPLADKRSFILRYSPMVLSPNVQDKVLIRVRGVNLDKSEPKLFLNDGSQVEMKIVGPQEISFWYPLSELDRKENKSQIHEINITHTTRDGRTWYGWPNYKEVSRTLLISTLPKEVGTYQLTATRSFNKEERKMYTVDMGRFQGRNRNVFKVAEPPPGYWWDLRGGTSAQSNFKIVTTGKGEKGRCEVIVWNGSNRNGIKGQSRCDEINNGYRRKDGYIHCGINGPIYRTIPTTENIKPINGVIYWNKDESIKIPKDVTSFELKLKLYNGEEKSITNTFSNDLIEVEKENERVIIRSTPPNDLIK